MDDHAHGERSDSDTGSIDSGADGWLEAAAGVWQAWLTAAGSIVVAVYFHLTESIWTTEAEVFYAEIFALVAVAALGYAVYGTHERTSPF